MSNQLENENPQPETITPQELRESMLTGSITPQELHEYILSEIDARKQEIVALSDEEMNTVNGGSYIGFSLDQDFNSSLSSRTLEAEDVPLLEIVENTISKAIDFKSVYHLMRINGDSRMQSVKKAAKIVRVPYLDKLFE